MEYDTLEVDIGPGHERDYSLAVRSLAGEAHATIKFPFDKTSLENRLLHLQNALLRSGGNVWRSSPQQKTVQQLGQELFDVLMNGEILLCYERSVERAQRESKGLRVQLRIMMQLAPPTPVVRYLNIARSIEPLKIDLPLRMLGMIANPQGAPLLDTDSEKERLERAVATHQQSGLIELTWVQGETWRELQRAMRSGRWHMFHFIGHGGFDKLTDEGFILLSDKQQQPHLLPATQLAELLTGYYPPRLVLLNSCDGAQGGQQDIFSSTASILIRRGIPAVVAMQYEITDQAAIEFSHSFYEALAIGLSVEAAIAEARQAIWISNHNSFEWGAPALYTHAPDGILFTMQRRQAEQNMSSVETENKMQPSLSEEVNEAQDITEQIEALRLPPFHTSIFAATRQTLTGAFTKQTPFLGWLLVNCLTWTVAVVVAVAVVAMAMNRDVLEFILRHFMVYEDRWVIFSTLTGTVVGAVVGVVQWFIVCNYITTRYWWIVASVVGLAVGWALGKVGFVVYPVSGAVSGAIGGAIAGAAQCFTVRNYVTKGHWWIVASTVSWALGWAVGGAVAVSVGTMTVFVAGCGAVGGAVGGAVVGVVQSSVLRKDIVYSCKWIMASIVSWAIGWAAGVTLVSAVGWAVVGAVGGAMAGAAQWFIVRNYIAKGHWWIVASTVGWSLGVGIFGAVIESEDVVGNIARTVGVAMGGNMGMALAEALANDMSGVVSGVVGGVVLGVVLGTAQWFILRHYIVPLHQR